MAARFPPPASRPDDLSFSHPKEIVAAQIDRRVKLELLEEWEQDLRRMLAASDENMPSTRPGEAGGMLQAVSDALIALGARSIDRPGVPTAERTKSRNDANR